MPDKAEKKVSWLELFFDLVFVTAVSYTTHLFISIEHYHMLMHLGEYLLMVFPMFWVWCGQTMFINRFGEHVNRQELFMIPQMFLFILMTASLDFDFNHTFYSFLAGYVGLRAIIVIEYFYVGRKLTQKPSALILSRLFIVGVAVPLCSLFLEGNARYVVLYCGIAADIILPLFFHRRLLQTPVNLPHLSERFGLFVLITFGESLVSVTNILVNNTLNGRTLAFALLSFLLICVMWYSYYYAYEKIINRHKTTNGQMLLYGHFFIFISVMILAGTIEMIQENHLERMLLALFLYGSIAVFYSAKSIVFTYYRKHDKWYYKKETLVMLLAMSAFFLINCLWPMSFAVNLGILLATCGLEALVQRRKLELIS